jgi:single-strand DNA-binding protein
MINQYFDKGIPIWIQGRLKQETWDDKATGAKRSRLKVVVETFQFVRSKSNDTHASTERAYSGATGTRTINAPAPAAETPPPEDQEVPF